MLPRLIRLETMTPDEGKISYQIYLMCDGQIYEKLKVKLEPIEIDFYKEG